MAEQYFNLEKLLENQRNLDNKFKVKMGFDKQRVLEELADCLHFALSYELNRLEDEPGLEEWNGSIAISREYIINMLPSIIHIFYHIIYLLNSLEYTIEEFYQVYEQVLENNNTVRTQNNY